MKGELAALRAVAKAARRFLSREVGNDGQYEKLETELIRALAKVPVKSKAPTVVINHCIMPGCHEPTLRKGLCGRHAAIYCEKGGAK